MKVKKKFPITKNLKKNIHLIINMCFGENPRAPGDECCRSHVRDGRGPPLFFPSSREIFFFSPVAASFLVARGALIFLLGPAGREREKLVGVGLGRLAAVA